MSLSFCRISCLVSVPAFVLFFSCTVSSSSSPQFFDSVFLFCSFESFQFLCVFLCSCTALASLRLPHIFDPPSGLFLCSGVPRVRCFRLGCVGVLIVLPCSPLPASSLGSAFPPCSVFLAVLRCPVVTLSSPFLEWFWLRFRFLFLFPSISFPSDFLLAFCLLPASFSVLSHLGLVGVRLRVWARSSVASLLPLPLYFRLRRVTLLSWVGFLPALLPLPPLCAVFLVFFRPIRCLGFFRWPSWCFSVLCSLFPCAFSAFDSLQ